MTPFSDVHSSPKTAPAIELMRLLHGELPAERAHSLRLRLEREPELAALYRRLEESWSGLALPEPAPAPLGFTRRVVAEMQRARSSDLVSWKLAPTWVRAATAAALAAGLAVGAVGGALHGRSKADEVIAANGEPRLAQSLADSYWTEVESDAALPSAETIGGTRP